MSAFLFWLRGFWPAPVTVNARERVRASGGALLGIFLTGLLTHKLYPGHNLPLLIAPMGASAVLLFAAPASPLAQPWSIMGGNILAALVGVTCALYIPDLVSAAAVAAALAIGLMFALRCLHPPSGAVALTAVLGGPAIHQLGYGFVLAPVGLNSALLLLVALAYNNLTRRAYPHPAHAVVTPAHRTADLPPSQRLGFNAADLDLVIQRYNQVLDVNRDDLEMILRQTEAQAYQRRFGEIRCADIMSRDIVSVEFGCELEEAWQLLRKHKVKALPVVDWSKRLIGIVTVVDFMKHADLDNYATLESKLRRLIQRTPGLNAEKPEVVGQIMSSRVNTVLPDQAIVEVVPLLSDAGMHHLPVIDDDRRLLGMITQSDVFVALYRGRLEENGIATPA